MLLDLYSLGLIFVAVAAVDFKEGDTCVTPNAENATCIPLGKCNVILAALTSGDPKQFQFYKESECSLNTGLVCCGSLGYQTNKTHTSDTKTSTSSFQYVVLSDFSDTSVCGLQTQTQSFNRIKGGRIAEFKEFPWLVALEYNSTYTKQNAGINCAGSLINDEYVLTAAHCIVHVEFVIIKVWLGVTNISDGGNCLNLNERKLECVNSTQKVNIQRARPHPKYDRSTSANDIGLVQLEHPIKFTEYIRPICIPWYSFPKIGTYRTITGWGTTEHGYRSDIKLKVDVPLRDSSICDTFLKTLDKKLTSKQLCAGGEKGKDSCQGDSGGPLIANFTNENRQIQWYQEAIISYGVGCGIEGRPAVYTKVTPYIEWIINRTRTLTDGGKDDSCETPTEKYGKCVPLNTCKTVFNAASTKNKTLQQFAKSSFCGYDDETVLVCCESPGGVIVTKFETEVLPNKTVCGMVHEERTIAGGEVADHSGFPWTVGIEYKDLDNDESIGIQSVGSLISNRYVLSSVGLISNSWKPFMAWLGNWNNSVCHKSKFDCENQLQKILIKDAIPHVFLKLVISVNIELILLENVIQFTDYIQPVCLPFPHHTPLELGTLMTASIWNTTQDGTIIFNNSEKVEASLISNEDCKSNSLNLCTETQDYFKALYIGHLMRRYRDNTTKKTQWFLEGSSDFFFVQRGFMVHTRISSFIDWIINTMSED